MDEFLKAGKLLARMVVDQHGGERMDSGGLRMPSNTVNADES